MAKKKLTDLTGQQVVQYYDPSGPAAGDLFWSMATSRAGCFIADGTDYLQADEPQLYAAIGSAFNTQINPTTGVAWAAPSAGRFRVPDMRGLVARGAGTASGATALAVGEYQGDQNKSHDHALQAAGLITSDGSITSQSFNYFRMIGGASGYSAVQSGASTALSGGNETRVKARGGNWYIRRYNPTAVSYNGGLAGPLVPGMVKPRKGQTAITVTCAQAGFTVIKAIAIWYQDQDGNHRMKFTIVATVTSASITQLFLSITGVVFKNLANYLQACAGFFGGVTPGNFQQCYANPNTSQIVISQTTGSATTLVSASGDVELEAKPSWA